VSDRHPDKSEGRWHDVEFTIFADHRPWWSVVIFSVLAQPARNGNSQSDDSAVADRNVVAVIVRASLQRRQLVRLMAADYRSGFSSWTTRSWLSENGSCATWSAGEPRMQATVGGRQKEVASTIVFDMTLSLMAGFISGFYSWVASPGRYFREIWSDHQCRRSNVRDLLVDGHTHGVRLAASSSPSWSTWAPLPMVRAICSTACTDIYGAMAKHGAPISAG